jgi:hypothetical protein
MFFPKSASKDALIEYKHLKIIISDFSHVGAFGCFLTVVVFTTDKSNKLSIDSTGNYLEAVMKHTEKDEKVGEDKVREIEKELNQHLSHLNKVFNIGETWGHKSRVIGAHTSTNTPAPALCGVRKDHKPAVEGGPPVRPICSAREAPNSRIGHFLSLAINNVADLLDSKSECRSTEEMIEAFEKINKELEEVPQSRKFGIISMDVKALYPSMTIKRSKKIVKKMIIKSGIEYEQVDWKELSRYLAVFMTMEEILEDGLEKVIPKRKKTGNRPITINYLMGKDGSNDGKWIDGRKPGRLQKLKW